MHLTHCSKMQGRGYNKAPPTHKSIHVSVVTVPHAPKLFSGHWDRFTLGQWDLTAHHVTMRDKDASYILLYNAGAWLQ